MKLMLIVSIALLTGCPKEANPPPTGDADAALVPHDARGDDASAGARKCCANMFLLSCPESAGQCATRIDLMTRDVLRVPPFEVDCCAGAGTKEAIRLCPGIRCE